MNSHPIENNSNLDKMLAMVPSGIVILGAFCSVLLGSVLFDHSRGTTVSTNTGIALVCFLIGWEYLSIWQVNRGCMKLGLNRSAYAQFVWGSRSNEPDDTFSWRWTLHQFYALLALGIFVLVLKYFG